MALEDRLGAGNVLRAVDVAEVGAVGDVFRDLLRMPARPRKGKSFGGSSAHQKAMMANIQCVLRHLDLDRPISKQGLQEQTLDQNLLAGTRFRNGQVFAP